MQKVVKVARAATGKVEAQRGINHLVTLFLLYYDYYYCYGLGFRV